VRECEHPSAGHGLPLTDPVWCRQLLTSIAAGSLATPG